MRIQYKGGVWKNTEDEILKAAVMKYGKNQWPRIASLLVRKSAKQCKARWYEWLDPSIKKTEWTREEEEKLLHLAKVMPTAWRTIAPMIGRTAAQCIEHYEKLIDSAQQGGDETEIGNDATAAGSAVNALKGRPGYVDSVPETKPARPDPVHMDDDELEMLSEARARLANTKGKKAKRKAREKHLEAAKRVARLQKLRELKAAGVPIKKPRKNRKITDYGTEIPFMRTPAPGFYDTREEDELADTIGNKKEQIGKLVSKFKQKTLDEKEEEQRAQDKAKRRKREEENSLAAIGPVKPAPPRSPPLKKVHFELPPPMLSDRELEKIVKSGIFPTKPPGSEGVENNDPSFALEEGALKGPTVGTPSSQAEPWAVTRDREVKAILSVQYAQTPLHGGTTPVSGLNLDGRVTPAPSQMRTPNPLATPSFTSRTSRQGSNQAMDEARRAKEEHKRLSDMVRKGLMSLPEPENEYQFDFNTLVNEEEEEDDNTTDAEGDIIEDAEEELRKREQQERENVPILREQLLSSVAKRDLPIANVVDMHIDTGSVEFLVHRDNAVRRIMSEYEKGERKAHEAINELRSLVTTDGADNGDLLKTARELVDVEIHHDENNNSALRSTIENAVMQEFDVRASVATEQPDKDIARIEIQKEYEEIETIIQKEGERRRQVLNQRKTTSKRKEVASSPDLESLWKKVEASKDGRVYPEAENAQDEASILQLIESLRQKVG